MALTTNRTERVSSGAVLVSEGREFVVRTASWHSGSWIVAFEGVSDRNAAAALSGTVLYAQPLEDPDELWVHELIGAHVIDQHGIGRGVVVNVVQNPASDLLELESGALVPTTFVTRLEPAERVVVDVPDGIFELVNDARESGSEPGTAP